MRLLHVLLLLLQTVWTYETTETEISFLQSLNQANMPLYERVRKVSVLDYPFQLIAGSDFKQFPQLDINFNTTFAQDVEITYSTNIRGNGGSTWISTYVLVDGKKIIQLGGMSAHLAYPGVFRTGKVYLPAGAHRVTVYYRGDYFLTNTPFEYEMINFLNV